MSAHYDRSRDRWIVRWRENGRQRARRFVTEAEAVDFDHAVNPREAEPPVGAASVESAAGSRDKSGVYPYDTDDGVRWRFVYRQSDGRLTTRRGFASRTAAQLARNTAVEEVRRGEVWATRDTFRTFWPKLLDAKRPYVTPGALQDDTTHGKRRLLPWFGDLRLPAIDEDCVRDWLADMTDLVIDGELRPKTVNHARTCLSMTLGEAVRRRFITQNPCRYVPELPIERTEIDYLRAKEIGLYFDACADFYRPWPSS